MTYYKDFSELPSGAVVSSTRPLLRPCHSAAVKPTETPSGPVAMTDDDPPPDRPCTSRARPLGVHFVSFSQLSHAQQIKTTRSFEQRVRLKDKKTPKSGSLFQT